AALALSVCGTPATAAEADWVAQNIPGMDAGVVKAACEEGKLSLYNVVYRNELKNLVAQFEKTFPCIDVTSFAATGSQLQQRFTSEQQAGRYEADVWETTTPGVTPKLAKDGLLADYTPP